MIQELKDFLLRGNVVELAVAVVIGAAFSAVITAFVENIINPIIGLLPGADSLDALSATIGGAEFTYGLFLSALLSFIAVGTVLFFVIRAYNKAAEMNAKAEEEEIVVEAPAEEIMLLREIRDQLRTNA